MGRLYIGCSGWKYKDWVLNPGSEGGIYPKTAPSDKYLEIYAHSFDTVEVKQTAHHIIPDDTMAQWSGQTPDSFRFTVVMWKEFIYKRQFEVVNGLLEKWFKPLRRLGEKLAVILIIIPSFIEIDQLGRLEEFLESLPQEYRYAIEFKHPSWLTGATLQLLQKRNVAWVSLYSPNEIQFLRYTGDVAYVRFQGASRAYKSFERLILNPLPAFQRMAEQIRAATLRCDVFVFVDNNFAGNAPLACKLLQQMLSDQKRSTTH